MEQTSTSNKALANQWSIRKLVVSTQGILDEAEKFIFQDGILPQGLVHRLHETINNMEAEVLKNHQNTKFKAENMDLGRNMATFNKEGEFRTSVEPQELFIHSKTLNQGQRNEILILDALQDDIKAIRSVVFIYMTNAVPLKKRSTSGMVCFSIFQEEMAILDGLLENVLKFYEPSHHVSDDVLEERLGVLPLQLNALFNTEVEEAAQKGKEIDQKAMMRMIIENQKRTEVLQHIYRITNRIKDLRRGSIQEDYIEGS